ncbi:MAG: DUF3341 domain-containing protein [Planctomycetota bacterium]|jgi:hypothetical protein
MAEQQGLFGMLAEFSDPAAVSRAAEKVRDAGYTKWDVYAPFPIHGIEDAMGLKPSRVSFFVGAGALTGVLCALLMQWWMSAVDYPMVIGGKPFFAWEQYLPITFELGVLLGSSGAILGMFVCNKLPMPYHPLMKKERFLSVSDDGFFIAIEASDPKFDAGEVRALLADIGGMHVEEVES